MVKENSKAIIKRLSAEVETLQAENEKLKKYISSFTEWYEEGKRMYAEGAREKAIRHLQLGRGKHGRIAAPHTVLLDYIKAGIKYEDENPTATDKEIKEKAVESIQKKYGLYSYASTIQYIRRARTTIKKKKPLTTKTFLKKLIPGNPTN